jgi:hypothetical protein
MKLHLLIVAFLAAVVIAVSQVITSFRWHGVTISILSFHKLIHKEGVWIYLTSHLVTASGGIEIMDV